MVRGRPWIPLWLAPVLLILLGGCGNSRTASPSPTLAAAPTEPVDSRWFPLQEGSSWIYQGTLGGRILGKKVFHCLREQEGLYVVEEYAGSRMLSAGRLLPGQDGGWRYLGGEMGSRDPGSQGALWLPRELSEGAGWDLFEGSRARVVGAERIEVPALGREVESLRVDYSLFGRERPGDSPSWYLHRSRWFSRGVGVVKEELPYRPGDWKTSFAAQPPAAHPGDRVVLLLQSWDPGKPRSASAPRSASPPRSAPAGG